MRRELIQRLMFHLLHGGREIGESLGGTLGGRALLFGLPGGECFGGLRLPRGHCGGVGPRFVRIRERQVVAPLQRLEKGAEAVVVFLQDRVELVVVAFRAADAHAEEHLAC